MALQAPHIRNRTWVQIGIDLGGTKTEAIVLASAGAPLPHRHAPRLHRHPRYAKSG
jgi:hypothetical protein